MVICLVNHKNQVEDLTYRAFKMEQIKGFLHAYPFFTHNGIFFLFLGILGENCVGLLV